MFRPLMIPLTALLLASCATSTKVEPEKPFGETGIPPALRSRNADAGTAVAAGGNVQRLPGNFQITPEEDMVFTDPDNPDAPMPELATVLSSGGPKRGVWEESETIARQRAAREGKALLIWFTDSKTSPMCKALSQELFSTPDFNKWAEDRIVRLRVDSNIAAAPRDPNMSVDEAETRRVNIRNYAANLKKRYRAFGHPTVVMCDSSGAVLTKYRGYKRGEANLFFGKIKHSEAVAANSHKQWRGKLEEKGYRDWTDRRGRKFFAKLAAYSKGTLILVEPDGTRARTSENKLSDEDRKWIEERKRLRGL
jgi:thioredoxin-related protein